MLRGKLLPLVNGCSFTRMAEWSNLHSSVLNVRDSMAYSRPRFKDARSKETPRLKDDFIFRTEGADRQYKNMGIYGLHSANPPFFTASGCWVLCWSTTRAKI